ncbi:unnamed protein product [Vicia faba]|uniref:Uncharacterized protein n=1 Tax=Vicia faba TaxID=3906 RepID=A0AAV1B400_VICFA|nr:unnamed protein product [Vicia faba]
MLPPVSFSSNNLASINSPLINPPSISHQLSHPASSRPHNSPLSAFLRKSEHFPSPISVLPPSRFCDTASARNLHFCSTHNFLSIFLKSISVFDVVWLWFKSVQNLLLVVPCCSFPTGKVYSHEFFQFLRMFVTCTGQILQMHSSVVVKLPGNIVQIFLHIYRKMVMSLQVISKFFF